MTEMRTWRMYAGRLDGGVPGREFMNFGSEETVRRGYGRVPVLVRLIEDPDGEYYGWIPTGETEPTMIQPHPGLFNMQFPYGPEAEVKHGRGEIVRMSCAALAETCNSPFCSVAPGVHERTPSCTDATQ